ncbi:hypothetical protein SAMN02910456_02198 [Ruminococcaceae bacterium YRB3002]|nr:hypothetical protein SAMN02910456_02198 [Ruminococcaceae bacterium YRB3002]
MGWFPAEFVYQVDEECKETIDAFAKENENDLMFLGLVPSIMLKLAIELIKKCPGHTFELFGIQLHSVGGEVRSIVIFDGINLKHRVSYSESEAPNHIYCEECEYEDDYYEGGFLGIKDRPVGSYIFEKTCPVCGKSYIDEEIWTDEWLLKVDGNGKFTLVSASKKDMDIEKMIADANGEDNTVKLNIADLTSINEF